MAKQKKNSGKQKKSGKDYIVLLTAITQLITALVYLYEKLKS